MADDIRLITIQPAESVQGIQPGSAPGGNATPTLFANLPSGSILSGFIVNRDASGNPILRTDKADIVFATNFFLKISSEVVIRVENRGGQPQAHILSVNGQPPEVAEGQSAFAGEPEVIVGNSPHNAQPRPGQAFASASIVSRSPVSAPLEATLLTPPAGSGAKAPPPLPAGTQLSVKIAAYTPPAASSPAPVAAAPAPATAPATNAPTNPLYAAYARPDSAPAPLPAAAEPVSAASPQSPLPATPSSASPPTTSPATPPAPGDTIPATVIGRESAGETLLHTPVGVVRLQTAAPLPTGSQLQLTVTRLEFPEADNALPGAAPASPPLTSLARDWSSLRQIFTLLAARAEQAGPETLALPALPGLLSASAAVPRDGAPPPASLPVALLVFVAALRGGDFRNWLGEENARWLQSSGHEALYKRAEGDFAALARPFAEPPPPGQWQPLFFPYVVAGELHQVRLFTKRDSKKDPKSGKKTEDTRFVLEIDLSQLGEMQMDGFVRKREGALSFDLIIRSHRELPDEVRRDILTIYNDTGELTGFAGTLQFLTVQEFPAHPLDELNSEHLRSLLV